MIRNVIFDWSGTLVDDLPAVLQASNFVLAQAGRPEMSLDQFRAEFQLPFTKFYDRHTPEVPMAQLEEWFHAEFRRAQTSVRELPHAREFLEFGRAQKFRMFLLSTIHTEHFHTQCKVIPFGQYFERAYTNVWDKRKVIHDILRENQLNPDDTVFIGDMEHDIATARHGGIHSCAVLTGYNTLAQLRNAQPDVVLEHLGELQRILTRYEGRLTPPDPAAVNEPPLATVGAVIFNHQGEVLMIRTHKWSGLWGIPGGKIKRGETALAALRRELKEETDLRVTDIRFVLVQDCISSREFYRDAHFVLLNYTCRCVAKKPKVTLNDESFDCRWVSLAEARRLKLNRPTRILLEAIPRPPRARRLGKAGK